MKRFREFSQELGINEIFGGVIKKFQMNQGAKSIAKDVVMEKIIKPALKQFSGAFENIEIKQPKGKNYLLTGYEFEVHLDLTDKYISRYKDNNFADHDFVRKVESAVRDSYKKWKAANKDDIHSEMVTEPTTMSTYAANIKNKQGEYEQNMVISFRILDGGTFKTK